MTYDEVDTLARKLAHRSAWHVLMLWRPYVGAAPTDRADQPMDDWQMKALYFPHPRWQEVVVFHSADHWEDRCCVAEAQAAHHTLRIRQRGPYLPGETA
ncbi:MAG TPA: hypothetical protein VKQ36_13345 [Ktedonobacterales bacterium]|nr:hypothetical protein [Ktedonobacterales bacterium]